MVDEAHRLKNYKSLLYQELKEVGVSKTFLESIYIKIVHWTILKIS